jgi:hypothetical protein
MCDTNINKDYYYWTKELRKYSICWNMEEVGTL